MAATAFPTLLNHLQMSSAIGRLRAQHAQASIEIVTGRIADPALELGAALGSASLTRKALGDIQSYRQTLALASARAGAAQASLAAMSHDAAPLSANIQSAVARGDETAMAIFGESAEARLRGAVGALNARVGDATLFSGDGVDGPALASADALLADIEALYAGSATAADFEMALDFYFNDPAGGFNQSIYLGGSGSAPRADLGDGEMVKPSARADEQPIRDLLRGLAAAAAAGSAAPGAMRDEAFRSAATSMRSGADGIAVVSARIGVAEERIEIRTQRLDAEEAALTRVYNGMMARDPYEAASRLQQIEAALEASYAVTARLTQLTLTRFLAP
ncbi:MAG: flagellin [Parvularculaceae bacterium]